jgi:hypothetical protein
MKQRSHCAYGTVTLNLNRTGLGSAACFLNKVMNINFLKKGENSYTS